MKLKVGIVTDSISNLPEDVAKKYDINMVKGLVYVDSKPYVPGIEITNKEILELIKTKTFKTAAPPPGDYLDLYNKIIDKYDLIISIHSPKAITAFIDSARMGAKRSKNPEKIIHVECGVTTVGLGLVSIATANLAQKITDRDLLISKVKDLCDKIEVLALVYSFEYVIKSGRVKQQLQGRLAKLFSFKPIIAIKNTKILTIEKPRNKNTSLKKFEQYFQKRFDPNSELKMIGMSQLGCVDEENSIRSIVEKNYPDCSILTTDVDPMIACNTGPGLLLLAYFSNTYDANFKLD